MIVGIVGLSVAGLCCFIVFALIAKIYIEWIMSCYHISFIMFMVSLIVAVGVSIIALFPIAIIIPTIAEICSQPW